MFWDVSRVPSTCKMGGRDINPSHPKAHKFPSNLGLPTFHQPHFLQVSFWRTLLKSIHWLSLSFLNILKALPAPGPLHLLISLLRTHFSFPPMANCYSLHRYQNNCQILGKVYLIISTQIRLSLLLHIL